MNTAIIYHSASGNTAKIAQAVAEGVTGAGASKVHLMTLESIDREAVEESQLVILGSPTYAGSCTWQMKRFLDTTGITLAGKLGGVFATENYLGGGADMAELTMISGMLVRGMLIFSAGASMGDPYTHFGAVAIKSGTEDQISRAKIFGARMAQKAIELFK